MGCVVLCCAVCVPVGEKVKNVGVCVCERGREREKYRHTNRHTETDAAADMQIDIQTNKYAGRQKQTRCAYARTNETAKGRCFV